MIKEAIVKIVNKEDLTYDEAFAVMNEIMSGETSPTQNAAFLSALSTKSAGAETTDEIAGCAAAMRSHALTVDTGMDIFEIVGTGGDNSQSFNISTTSAIIAAAGGMKVAKHGNRAASSKCGAADCLEALGVNINQSPEKCRELLREVGICFFFAQKYHTSMKYVGAIRKELGFRTVFNILGPLTNPGKPSMQILGVYAEYLVAPLAQVLINLGVKRGMVVYGRDKLDEISLSAPTSICEINDGWIKNFVITPEEFGFARCTKKDLRGGDPEDNAVITRSILRGERGHKRNAVLLNAGAALYIGGKAETIKEGIEFAADLIDSGKALETLEKFITVSQQTKKKRSQRKTKSNPVPVRSIQRRVTSIRSNLTILEEIAELAKIRVAYHKAIVSSDKLKERALSLPRGNFPFEAALKKPGLSFICECKKASPSKGIIAEDFQYLDIAREYAAAGADAISVLTEPEFFLGRDKFLAEIAAQFSIPCLRKDFVIDEYMLYQAKILGASAVLLICAILNDAQLKKFIATCDELGLSALVEAHDEDEIKRAIACGARIIGVNNRNLKDFSVDMDNAKKLRALVPPEIIFVSESGVQSADDIKKIRELGADAVLIGEVLMRAADKKSKLAELKGDA